MRKFFHSAIALPVLLGGCASMFGSHDASMSGLTTEPAPVRVGAFVTAMPRCPVSDTERFEMSSLIASFAGDFLFSYVDAALKDYQEGLNGAFVASGVVDGELGQGSCIIIANGPLGPVQPTFVEGGSQFSSADLQDLHLADVPAFYLEARVLWDPDQTHLTLRPEFLSYAASSARTRGSGAKHVSLVMTVDETAADATANASDSGFSAVYRINLGELEIGRHYDAAQLRYTGASQAITPADLRSANVSVLVTESEDPSLALQALSAAYQSNSGALQSAFEDMIASALDRRDDRD